MDDNRFVLEMDGNALPIETIKAPDQKEAVYSNLPETITANSDTEGSELSDEGGQVLVQNTSDSDTPYVVRGALLRCSCGTHKRRLDLRKDHGMVFTDEDGNMFPMATTADCLLETEDEANANIKYFGICKNTLNPPTTDNIYLVGENGEGRIKGPKCDLSIDKEKGWQRIKEDAKLNESNLLTMDSILICRRCALVEIETNGMEYTDNTEE